MTLLEMVEEIERLSQEREQRKAELLKAILEEIRSRL
jgi:hypothetical protein